MAYAWRQPILACLGASRVARLPCYAHTGGVEKQRIRSPVNEKRPLVGNAPASSSLRQDWGCCPASSASAFYAEARLLSLWSERPKRLRLRQPILACLGASRVARLPCYAETGGVARLRPLARSTPRLGFLPFGL